MCTYVYCRVYLNVCVIAYHSKKAVPSSAFPQETCWPCKHLPSWSELQMSLQVPHFSHWSPLQRTRTRFATGMSDSPIFGINELSEISHVVWNDWFVFARYQIWISLKHENTTVDVMDVYCSWSQAEYICVREKLVALMDLLCGFSNGLAVRWVLESHSLTINVSRCYKMSGYLQQEERHCWVN